jgi:hypothetical protein
MNTFRPVRDGENNDDLYFYQHIVPDGTRAAASPKS